tara:strand:- start:7393 stop:9918 length:2526 start_codon:yes stop_codon:yes gene_type:complete
MTARLILISLFFSIHFSYSINYNIENDNLHLIDGHFIINKSNAAFLKGDSIFDIYRLEFIVSNSKNITYNIKSINWAQADQKLPDLGEYSLVEIGDQFYNRGCPSIYLDIFPYKIENNKFYYIESMDIEFTINEFFSNDSCIPSKNIINKNFIENSPKINDGGIDYLIITNSELINSAEKLADIHHDLNIDIVDIELIYSLYSDFAPEEAVRNYVIDQMALELNLNYLLILGDETIVPPIYKGDKPSDDYYSSPEPLEADPLLATGRIPIVNVEDADSIVSKIEFYIENLENSIDDDYSWRNTINLVSDDENNPNPDKYPEVSHTENSNLLYNKIKENFIVNTFYGVDYIPIQQSDGLVHLDLSNALIENINRGVSMINYIGHGNSHTLADEKIIVMDRDLNVINTSDYKLPIWVVGTCSFGQYVGQDSMSEALLLKDNGAIAVIATVDAVTISQNISYLDDFFHEINEYVEGDTEPRLGDIIKDSKEDSPGEDLFHLFGDPALPLPFPRKSNAISDNIPEEILIGNQTNINVGPYNAILNVFDAEQQITRTYETGEILEYSIPGQSIYSGSFYEEACFITSLDASECEGCASMFIQTEDSPYNLYQNIFGLDIIDDSNNFEDTDTTAPEVFFLTDDYMELYNGDTVFENRHLTIRLQDQSGINLTGGLGHNIRYWFNNEENQQIISSNEFNYTSSCDEISTGEFIVELENLNLGGNTLYVEAWDNLNNKVLSSITLLLVDSDILRVYDAYNFPNPFSDFTNFTFRTSAYPLVAKITIFDLSGKKIKVLDSYECNSSFCSIKWDGKDSNSNLINNGTYIYQLKIINEQEVFEDLYKLTKLK